jgi:L-gulonate 3-dehydrogenase
LREHVAIVGAGLIGRAWAVSFARGGHEVALWDPDRKQLAAALKWLDVALRDLSRAKLLKGRSPAQIKARIRRAASLEDAVGDATYVQENSPEKLAIKRRLFAVLDRIAPPKALLVSSTSALLPSSFTAKLKGRARTVVAHPANPPYLMPIVEIAPAPWTSGKTVERVRAIMTGIGQVPIVLKKEIDGFILNRLQIALYHEAYRLLSSGYASARDIDLTLSEGLALRWVFLGAFGTMDLNAPGGIKDYISRYEATARKLGKGGMGRLVSWAAVARKLERELEATVPRGKLQARQEWRDRRLMALLAHKAEAQRRLGA